METVKTAGDKQALLKMRREEQRRLGATIDHLMANAEEPTPGCGLCSVWRRLTRSQKRAVATAMQQEEGLASSSSSSSSLSSSSSSAQVAKSATSAQSRLFGMRKQSANEKLAQTAEALNSRLLQLESRAASEREEAKLAMKAGQKASAMRMLKRAKMTDKQVEGAQQSLLALEQQVDLMAQAAMQKEIASALATSSKGFKANKKMVANAEAAVDDAQEARDMAEDLSNALQELGGHDNGDDDELMEELHAMANDDPPNTEDTEDTEDTIEISLVENTEEAKRIEIARLEARTARWEEAQEIRSKMPSAPKGKTQEEKQSLLAAA